jgi:molybdopterin-containing oxidoreductase family iron-sulfur binding subunit
MSTDDTHDNEEPRHPYETEDSFHPLGADWEDRMREELEDTEFDADLGMQMARDAQRLVAGEITEEEFYAEYHDDVEEEFELDERPVFDDIDDVDLDAYEDDESILEALTDVDFENEDVSRREMMKKMGAGAAFLGYGAFATYDNGEQEQIPGDVSGISPSDAEDREHRWGMVIDLERCDGCLACVTGCINENGTSTGANWMYVFTYEDEDTEQQNFLVRPCQHCSNAPCAKVCPVRARHARSEDGIVLTDYEICIGCRYCQVACPYGVNYFQWGEPDVPMEELTHLSRRPEEVREMDPEERHEALSEANDHIYDDRGRWVDSRPPQGVMGKCTFCPSRQDGQTNNEKGTVACMDACDEAGMSAIHFGDLDDPESRPNRYLEARAEQEFEQSTEFEGAEEEEFTTTTDWGKLSSFQLLEELNTQPNITYLGNEPGAHAEQVEGPVTYEQLSNIWGVEVLDERKEHLDYGARANRLDEKEEEEGEA